MSLGSRSLKLVVGFLGVYVVFVTAQISGTETGIEIATAKTMTMLSINVGKVRTVQLDTSAMICYSLDDLSRE